MLAVEIDDARFEMLENNVSVSRLGDTVTCVRGDFARLVDEAFPPLRDSEVVFLDPPWGGKAVDAKPGGFRRARDERQDAARPRPLACRP